MKNISIVKVTGQYEWHEGNTWRADSTSGSLSGPIKDITTASTAEANLWVYFCKDQTEIGTVGLAWVGSLCNSKWKPYQAGITEKQDTVLNTAKVILNYLAIQLTCILRKN